MSVFKNFPGLENLKKKFKDFQGPARALILHNHMIYTVQLHTELLNYDLNPNPKTVPFDLSS